jgi:hypothetical protein
MDQKGVLAGKGRSMREPASDGFPSAELAGSLVAGRQLAGALSRFAIEGLVRDVTELVRGVCGRRRRDEARAGNSTTVAYLVVGRGDASMATVRGAMGTTMSRMRRHFIPCATVVIACTASASVALGTADRQHVKRFDFTAEWGRRRLVWPSR